MSDIGAVRAVATQVASAKSYAAVFGSLPKGDKAAQRSHIRKSFAYLAKIVHPDHAPVAIKTEAEKAFESLNAIRQRAEEAIEHGRYDETITAKPATLDTDFSELSSAIDVYRLRTSIFAEGDFSVLYRGVAQKAKTPIIAKVAREPTDNTLLENEAAILRRIASAKAGDPLSRIARFMPKLVDTFVIGGAAGTRYRVEILGFKPDTVSVADIIAAYPRGLDAPQAAWVARRIIAQTLAAAMFSRVHGAITPDHVLVDPFTHEPLHIGWAHAIERGRITLVIDRWRELYPPEVFAKKDADHRTDIYMAGATIVKLLGGDVKHKKLPSVPGAVSQIILRCLEENPDRRPQDGRNLLDEFTRVVRKEWGRAYRPLSMPVR